ncbi:hypothetical protein D3C86_1281620 [compost metagenome]
MVGGLVRQHLERRRHFQQRVESGVQGLAQQTLGQSHGVRRVGGDRRGDLPRRIQQLLGGDNAGHQVPLLGLASVDHLSGQGQFGGTGQTDDAWQQPGTAVARNDPQLDETLGKLRVLRRHADVAHARQIQPRADGRAIDRGDHRYFQIEQRQGQALNAGAIFLTQLHARHLRVAIHVAHVATGAERGAGASDDHCTHTAVAFDSLNGFEELRHGAVPGQRVASLGVIHRQGDDMTFLFVFQKRAHE